MISLLRVMLQGDGDLLSLLPASAYRVPVGPLGYSRRQIVIVNEPSLYKEILNDPAEIFPKNDLMVGALEPLVGDSIFVSSGEKWRLQRRMIDPAFSHMRLQQAFPSMQAAVTEDVARLKERATRSDWFSLDMAMSHLTADIICRTVFSTPLAAEISRGVFEDFTRFERSVAHVELFKLIVDPAWKRIPQHPDVEAACKRIRERLGALLDTHLTGGITVWNDIASEIASAEDANTRARFTREELIDQLGVMFLAGHETTASVLTWVFFILSQDRASLERVRHEVSEVVGDGAIQFEHIRKLTFTRNVFREALRLYPPITFIPRVAAAATTIGTYRVKRGAMIMISPWAIHRNPHLWPQPDAFDPDRFDPSREAEQVAGAYLPFGLGPRVCVGAAFAATEATLIIATLARMFDFELADAASVRPVARLTTRPKDQIMCRVVLRT